MLPKFTEILLITFSISMSAGMISVSSPNETVITTIKDRTLVRTDVVIQGYLVVAKPNTACRNPSPPPVTQMKNSQGHAKYILLANLDDSCSIGQKAESAKKAGYAALLVKNVGTNDTGHWVPSVGKFGSSSSSDGGRIYTGVIGQHDGDLLQNKYNCTTGYLISIEMEASWKTVYYFALFGCLFIAFIFACWFLRMFVFNSFLPRTYPGLVERYRELERSVTQRFVAFRLQRLPVQKWTNFDDGPIEVCAICLDEFSTDDWIRVLNCSHVFHLQCIDHWLVFEKHRCPICISNVFAKTSNSNKKPLNIFQQDNVHSVLLAMQTLSADSSSMSSNNSAAIPNLI